MADAVPVDLANCDRDRDREPIRIQLVNCNIGAHSCNASPGRGVQIVSGTGDGVVFPVRFRHVPIVSKPVGAAALAHSIAPARDLGS